MSEMIILRPSTLTDFIHMRVEKTETDHLVT